MALPPAPLALPLTATGPAALRLQLLGVARLCGAPGSVALPDRLLGRNDALLLTVLARLGPLPRSRVAALLWPDHAPAAAARNLRQRVHQLKRAAGADLLLGDPVLALAPGVLHDLIRDDAWLDAALAGDAQALRGALLDGIDLAAQDELADLVLQWRLQWDVLRARALHRAVDRAWAAGDAQHALQLARRLVDDNPGAEAAHQRLIELHYLLGDNSSALAAYADCRQALQQHQGTAPSAAIEALVRALHSAQRPAPAAAQRPDAVLMRPPRLVGRDAIWVAASASLAAARPVLLTGEAGIGKTRLLGDLAAALGGWVVVSARRGDADLPYALLARLVDQLAQRFGPPTAAWVGAELARLVPALGRPPVAEPFSVQRLQRALVEALRGWSAVDSGVVAAGDTLHGLALDDLHFADLASLDLIAPLVGESTADGPAGRLAWLLAARPAELVARAPAWQQHMADPTWLRLALAPLDPAAVHELLVCLQLPGLKAHSLAPRLAQSTGGNPLFVLQTVAAMRAQGGALPDAANVADAAEAADAPAEPLPAPQAAVGLIAQRITLLSPQARQLLRVAALAGADFSAGLASTVLGQPPLAIADAWAELQAAQLLRASELAHDLVREAALAELPAALAQATHRQLAQALAADGAAPALLARHWQAGQAWMNAARAWDAAAHAAHARSATAEELAALQSAQACLQAQAAGSAADDGGLTMALGLRGVRAQLCSYAPDAALAQLQSLQALLQDDRQRAQWLQLQAQVLVEQQQSAQGLDSAYQALGLAHRLGDHHTALLAAQCAAKALMRLDRLPEAMALMPAAPPGLQQLPLDARLYWLCDRALLLEHANLRLQSLAAYDQVIGEALAQQCWMPAADACSNKAVALMYLGRLADSNAVAEQSIALSRRAGVDGVGLLIDEMNLAGNWRDLGWFARYLARAERLPAELDAAGMAVWAANSAHDLAVAYAWLGRVDLAHRQLGPLADGLPDVMHAARLITRLRLARDFDAGVLAPQPQVLLDSVQVLLDRGGNRGGMLRQALAMERGARAAPAEGAAQLAQIETEALGQQNIMAAASASRLRIQQLLAAGAPEAAAQTAQALLARCADHGPPPGSYAPALWWAASLALAPSSPALAAQLLRQAVDWISQAASHTPPLFRDSFFQRNPVNRAVLQAAAALR